MNFLAHLWLSDRAGLPLAGALLGDSLRGPLPASLPPALAQSVRLHRRVDVETDRHPIVVAARRRFAPGPRRYAGILIDILLDHALARDWARYSAEPLPAFAARAAHEIEAAAPWFEGTRHPAPRAAPFAALLRSYAEARGIEHAIERTAQRLRQPQGLLEAMAGWPAHAEALRADLPRLLDDLAARAGEAIRPPP